MSAALTLVANNAAYRKWERDWLLYLLGDFTVEEIIDPDLRQTPDRAVVLLGGPLYDQEERIDRYLRSFGEQGKRVGLIHLSDECYDMPIGYYRHAAFVFRNYWRRDAAALTHCRYFPLGYTANFVGELKLKPIAQRQHRFCFAGERKKTRYAMLDAAQQIPGGRLHITKSWDDPAGLKPPAYAAMLCDSVFALCPAGNVSPDTFRLYEALEAGCIPIVEDDGGLRAWTEVLAPAAMCRVQPWRPGRWRNIARKLRRPSYWDHAFENDFPCPRICHWQNLSVVMKNIDVETTAARIQSWWGNYKTALRRQFGVFDRLGHDQA